MANVFLSGEHRDIETAIMLEQAIIHDIGNAVAYTDGDQIYVNTDDNLNAILPAYSVGMLKWLLWHERFHNELKHHNRFFKYVNELSSKETEEKFELTKEEVNIIMDILVHDSLARMFPELVETAITNLAQMRTQNSLKYTFTTNTLEKMLNEYREHKKKTDDPKPKDDDPKGPSKPGKGKGSGKGKSDGKKKEDKKDDHKDSIGGDGAKHGAGGTGEGSKSEHEDEKPTIDPTATRPDPGKHDETDWSKLDDIDSKEFITKDESEKYQREIAALRRKKIRLGKLTETLNGLVTSTRRRTYAMPSTVYAGRGVLLKGSTPGRTQLYLCFDASGSMGPELQTFKEIISKSIPQAMNTPCVWFSGRFYDRRTVSAYKVDDGEGYYKGKFSDMMPVRASSGFNDDGDRVIELCWEAEQQGYSPIGVTDGGGQISWSIDKLKQLKRTVLVGPNDYWLREAKEINPKIQTLEI